MVASAQSEAIQQINLTGVDSSRFPDVSLTINPLMSGNEIFSNDEGNFLNNTNNRKNIIEESTEKIYNEFESLEKKLYLNPNLNLEIVAKELNISSNYLSQIINARGVKFNDYINTLRVEKVKIMEEWKKVEAAGKKTKAAFAREIGVGYQTFINWLRG